LKVRHHLFFTLALVAASAAIHSQNASTPSAAAPVVVAVPSAAPQSPAAAQPAATAQPATSHLQFDVATVKSAAQPDFQRLAADFQNGKMPRLGPHVDASRAEYIYMSLKDLIVTAYNVKPYQVDGPSWLGETRFDIQAKMPDGSTKDDAPAMLQALLAERFKLAVHRSHEEHKVLALIVGKAGPKLKESSAAATDTDPNAPLQPGERKIETEEGTIKMKTNSDGSMTMNMGKRGTFTEKLDMSTQSMHIEASTLTMDGFADMLTSMMQAMGGGGPQVVNMTGLKGNYQVVLDLSLAALMNMARSQGGEAPGPLGGTPANAPADAASDPQGVNSVSSSLGQMGLKFEERKATVERLVVDHVEKTPVED
jgi:uncharacterized protein (TIGR03435 family)